MSIMELEAQAQEAMKARFEAVRAYHAGFPYASEADRISAWDALPSRCARFNEIECEAIVPENRTAYRRRHFRFIYRISGKRATVEAAAALLHA